MVVDTAGKGMRGKELVLGAEGEVQSPMQGVFN